MFMMFCSNAGVVSSWPSFHSVAETNMEGLTRLCGKKDALNKESSEITRMPALKNRAKV